MGMIGQVRQWRREVWVMAQTCRNWPVMVRHYYRWLVPNPPVTVTYRLRQGPRLAVDSGQMDAAVVKEIWGDRGYEVVPGFAVRPGWRVLDLGAHKGVFAVRAALAGAEVTAVEPEARNLELLRRNLAANGVERVRVCAAAVAPAGGEGWLLRRNSWSHGLEPFPDDPPVVPRERVPLVGFAELVAGAGPGLDLVKMDAEGAERAVLQAASAETLGRVRRLVIEYHPIDELAAEEVGAELARLLTGHGFRCRAVWYNLIFATREAGTLEPTGLDGE